MLRPARKRAMADWLMETYRVSARKACMAVALARSTYLYRARSGDDTLLRMRIREIARTRVRYGYKRIHTLLRREGMIVISRRCTGCTARTGSICVAGGHAGAWQRRIGPSSQR